MMDHQQNQQIVEKFKCFNCFGLMYNQIYDCNEGKTVLYNINIFKHKKLG